MRTRELARFALAVALLMALAAACAGVSPAAPQPSASTSDVAPVDPLESIPAGATVTKVVDGDTLHAQLPDLTDETVRMIGVNTPETTKGKHECMGKEATDLTRDLTLGKTVVLTKDPTQNDRDRYSRAIRYVDLADGTDVSLQLIQAGLGKEVQYAAKYQRQVLYQQSQRAAQTEGRGGWAPVERGGCGWKA